MQLKIVHQYQKHNLVKSQIVHLHLIKRHLLHLTLKNQYNQKARMLTKKLQDLRLLLTVILVLKLKTLRKQQPHREVKQPHLVLNLLLKILQKILNLLTKKIVQLKQVPHLLRKKMLHQPMAQSQQPLLPNEIVLKKALLLKQMNLLLPMEKKLNEFLRKEN